MPALPFFPGVAMVQARGVSGSGLYPQGCRWHLMSHGGFDFTPADITAIATLWSDSSTSPLVQLNSVINSDFKWTSIKVTDLSSTGTIATASCSIQGTDPSAALPPQCSIAISWGFAGRWRGGKPRTYLPGASVGALVAPYGSALSAGYASGVDASAHNFQVHAEAESLSAGTPELGFVSYYTGKALRATPVFFQFTSAETHLRLDSQRKRSGKESAYGIG